MVLDRRLPQIAAGTGDIRTLAADGLVDPIGSLPCPGEQLD